MPHSFTLATPATLSLVAPSPIDPRTRSSHLALALPAPPHAMPAHAGPSALALTTLSPPVSPLHSGRNTLRWPRSTRRGDRSGGGGDAGPARRGQAAR